MLSLQLSGMGDHSTSQSLGTGGRVPFGGIHGDDCRRGAGVGPHADHIAARADRVV